MLLGGHDYTGPTASPGDYAKSPATTEIIGIGTQYTLWQVTM